MAGDIEILDPMAVAAKAALLALRGGPSGERPAASSEPVGGVR